MLTTLVVTVLVVVLLVVLVNVLPIDARARQVLQVAIVVIAVIYMLTRIVGGVPTD